jgi:hypothetical protein
MSSWLEKKQRKLKVFVVYFGYSKSINLVVSDPTHMMEEIFLHFSGPTSALPAMLQILADFASTEG